MTNTNTDLHAVFAYTTDGKRYRVDRGNPGGNSYNDSLTVWQRLEDRLKATTEPTRINGSQVKWFNVRSMDDADWNDAPHAIVQHGYVASDYDTLPGFNRAVNDAIKQVKSEQMKVALTYGARYGNIPYDTHAKTREGLANRGLTSGMYSYGLTELGKAVAAVLHLRTYGKTAQQHKDEQANQKRALAIKQAARRRNYKARVATLAPTLAGLTFSGKPAVDALLEDTYRSDAPLYKHNPKCEGGKISMTVKELEALIARVSE